MGTATAERSTTSPWPRFTPALGAGAALLTVAYLGLFFRWFERQGLLSYDGLEDWGHAFIIPVISAFFIWRNRERIEAEAPEVFWPGLAPMLLGIMSYFYAVVAIQSHMIEGFAVLLTLFGLTLLLLGPAVMRWLVIPIGYLIFGITLAEIIMITVTFQLQLLASEGAWVILGAIGSFADFTIDLDGNTLRLYQGGRTIPLNVAEACSGMRMVVAFYALSVWVALTWCRQWWQRIALFLCAGPVAVFMNMIRVAVLGLLSIWDSNLAAGQAHTMIGTLLLIPSLGLYLGIAWALNRVVADETQDGKATR
ncbi:MAG: exosortase/archaeosortase family protein [Phycisphaerales bacterium]|nr:exosortase/archaeosortase family protein [Phycisphaerales bacterium]